MPLLLLIASTLSPYVAAQNTTFDPDSVDPTTKNQWCQSEIDNCLLLCGGDGSTLENACQSGTLEYTCTCLNKSSPANIAQYQGTIPNYLCQRAYSQCTTGVEGLSSSERCQKCGKLQPSNLPDSASLTPTASPSTEASSSGASTNHMATAPTTEATPVTLPTASPEAAKSSPATTGLSSPAKIGVGVGVSLGVVSLAIIIIGLMLLRRRRNRRSEAVVKSNGGDAEKSGTTNKPVMQELDGDGDKACIVSGVPELDAIESPTKSRELTGSPGPPRYELE